MTARLQLLALIAAVLTACGPGKQEALIARNRSLADIERACVRKAEARLQERVNGISICSPADAECRPRFLAAESEHCQCANRRMAAEFTASELDTLARIELLEAQITEINAREPNSETNSDLQLLVQQHHDALGSVSSADQRRRLSGATGEAGHACRTANYDSRR